MYGGVTLQQLLDVVMALAGLVCAWLVIRELGND